MIADLRAALEAAITAERERVLRAIAQRYGRSRTSDLDRYGDLCDMRGRWDEHAVVHRRDNPEKPMWCGRCPELQEKFERLLKKDSDDSV